MNTTTTQAAPATRTFTTRKGKVVVTPLTDAEALAGLRTLTSTFAQDLAAKAASYGLSYDQMAWAHALVLEASRPAPAAEPTVGDLAGVFELFRRAGQKLQHPKVRLVLGDAAIRLSVAGERARFPGSIQVILDDDDRTWLGRIHTDGRYEESRRDPAPAGLVDLLRRFAAEPQKVAKEYGRLLGRCCFCDLELKDKRSTLAGYGETCSKHYGLPYPTKREAEAADPLQS